MLQIQERLGDFEIIRLLGKGGMGEVYEARQFNPERRVALKVLTPWLADDEESLERFLKEAKVPANLDHPGIVRIITTGTERGVAYYTMHLVRGISLSEMIRKANVAANSDTPTRDVDAGNTPSAVEPAQTTNNPPVSPAPEAGAVPPVLKAYRHDRFMTVARIGAQAARALAFAHDQGVLHRDIKPSNLMVDFHNYVYVVDFGLTRALEQRAADSTLPGTLIGTPWYMSPEQADSKPLDARSDIYSLGVTLYELATRGIGPFTASRDNKQSVLAEVRAGKTLPLRMLASDIPPALEQIILRAMQLKPTKRYASAADMARDLEAFCGQSADLSPHRPFKPAPAPAPRRRWPIWIGGALLGAALLTAAAVAVAMRDRSPVNEDPKGKENALNELAKPKLDGAKAFPLSLRQPGPNVPTRIMDRDQKPVWQKDLYGKGNLSVLPGHLQVHTFGPYMVAFADPDRPKFIFDMELKTMTEGDVGIFFGWRLDAKEQNDYFMVKLDPTPSPDGLNPHGMAIIGTGIVRHGSQGDGKTGKWFTPLRDGKATIRLPDKKLLMQSLRVVVLGDTVTVSVGESKAQTFTVADVLADGRVGHKNLGTSGAVGVWVKSGLHVCANGAITIP